MHLKKLQIRNFRKNRHLDVTLGVITTIRGSSSRGKSSLIGALRWIAFNTPTSDRYISWGAKKSAVRLTMANGCSIVRKRGKSENLYQMTERGKQTQTYKAFGRGIPKPIEKTLRLDPLNFRRQHDGHFWFSESPSAVSRQLNEIVALDAIDTGMQRLGADERAERIKLADTQERIEEARRERDQRKDILKQDRDLAKVEALYAEYVSKALALDTASDLIRRVHRHRKVIDRLSGRLVANAIVLKKGGLALKQAQKREKTLQLLSKLRALKRRVNLKVPDLQPVIHLFETWTGLYAERNAATTLLENTRDTKNRIEHLEERLNVGQKRFSKIMKSRPTCPLCKQRLRKGRR